ncbi:class C beta-lactamase-related serine hydrolase [Sphingomonas koreensis]|uniref:Class C beta-lactamase-related serine hydrolase n=1 Tax=Sphingomonas koreensis TaxID=93064 RepID=A0A430G8J7_9SPHN|nr:serine hydrolase [Sphingomonas koreensis]RSY89746.1 class C beta-lactamase-related serine hydrolase [Sphingomonas koreensis]
MMMRAAFLTAAMLVAVPAAARPARIDLSAMSAEIEAGKYRKIEAIRVIRDGRTVFEGDYRGNTPESRIDARSSGKSITALAIGMAIDDGKLASVDLPVFEFFKDREPFAHDGPAKRAITIRDLLTMSSALDCDDWTDASPGNEERMYATRDWTRFALDIPIAGNYARGANGLGRYSYCTAGAFLLGRIVERVTGERFDVYVQRRLFDPLGITGAQWKTSPNGEVQSGGQLSLRARDFAAIGQLVLDGGMASGKQVVSRAWLREMLTVRAKATPFDGYGYLWWVRDYRTPDNSRPWPGFYMSGNGGNKAVLFPDLKAVVVILSTNYNQRDMHQLSTALIERHILPALVTP